jgi:hypothetical protein
MRVVSGRDTNDRVRHCIAKRRFGTAIEYVWKDKLQDTPRTFL